MTRKKEPIEVLLKPINDFLHKEASGGILLIIFTVVALIWANSPWSDSYHNLWNTYISINTGDLSLKLSFLHWINDGLMVIFFFVVGLEIKRELLVGELSSVKKASLPVAGAIGGMLVPALFYVFFTSGTEAVNGWGIPMATDIAFVVGILAILGSRVPLGLKVFVVSLAIADDIGAVLVIAIFYTSQISISALLAAAVILVLLGIVNKLGVKSLIIYSTLGLLLWLAVLQSGIHATIAGVLLAFTIPVKARINTKRFSEKTKDLLDKFNSAGEHGENVLTNENRQTDVMAIEENCKKILTPLQRFEHGLHPWSSFLIIPLFALANAGVTLTGMDLGAALTSSVSVGIIAGLFLGKQFGIFAFAWLAVKIKLASLPEGVSWRKIYGGGILAGIGFTMSLFIAGLAFTDDSLLNLAKIGILTASLIAGVVGYLFLKASLSKTD
ncbi:MAG: Na+/H+ antiporter NhaA [Bacteroidetes bacterium]|nr:Na+/H+ antiporter NhaA [Bacteroidota bacterium]